MSAAAVPPPPLTYKSPALPVSRCMAFLKDRAQVKEYRATAAQVYQVFTLGDQRFNEESLSTKGKLLYLTGNMGYESISSMRSKADQWDLHSIGTNHHDNFLGNSESSYEKKVRCQS